MSLLNRHFSLAPLVLWDPTAAAQIAPYYEEEFTTVVDVDNHSAVDDRFRRIDDLGDGGGAESADFLRWR